MDVAILGAGALGRIAANILSDEYDVAFFDDDEEKVDTEIDGVPVVGDIDDVLKQDASTVELLVGIGDRTVRSKLYRRFVRCDFSFVTAIHPTASVASTAEVEAGAIVKDNAVVEVGAHIGKNTVVGNGTVICHDTNVGEHCRLAPGVTIAGHCSIGPGSYLAVNVSVDRKVSIGEEAVVASGCTIWKNVPDGSVVKLPQPMDLE